MIIIIINLFTICDVLIATLKLPVLLLTLSFFLIIYGGMY